MSGLETAIRTALENSDRDNPEVRARIYQSARQALEAGLRKQDITDTEVVAHHRHRLESTIHAIEGEERDRLHPRQRPPEVPVPPVVEMPAPPVHQAQVDEFDGPMVSGETRAPDVAPNRGDESSLDDVHAGSADHLAAAPVGEERLARGQRATNMDFRPERAAGRRKPRKFFSRLLVWCVLLAFIGIGAWWAHTSGLLMTAAERDTSVANPPASTQPEDFTGNDDSAGNAASHTDQPVTIDPQNSFSADWIPLFKPEDADKIQSGPRARTEKIVENDGPAVRLISESGTADGNISISVPPSVLQQLAGKSSTIALTLQSTTDEPTQITVECNFQTLGNCARHRFNVTREKSDALLQVKFDRSLAPNSPGTLTINSDLDGKARGINLFAIRILPGQ
ncbi:regulator [Rhizobium ruizarguesonis]|uniref:Regulator n=1 Tax=Rhizobium ruizarguesonis TaxID=2081791 RepID=A0AAE4YXL3_9HYPH|nr:regulator [Rhizobium ruizarguesonis]MBY5884366.1 regulator [Rhizobium leguminosarum]NKJ77260.1 regulator [Rhizobium leguminosarum bv. viciae]MBY5898424.1 regulator [Rhizobium leguminosarum]MCB2405677.1 regulator [Rhizobium ruizarguesonis]NEH39975.1 regulator [Rhizobium ruizarguesonis]